MRRSNIYIIVADQSPIARLPFARCPWYGENRNVISFSGRTSNLRLITNEIIYWPMFLTRKPHLLERLERAVRYLASVRSCLQAINNHHGHQKVAPRVSDRVRVKSEFIKNSTLGISLNDLLIKRKYTFSKVTGRYLSTRHCNQAQLQQSHGKDFQILQIPRTCHSNSSD